MRFISFILAIYLLGLATISCGDKDGCSQGSKNATAYIQANDCQDTQHTDELCPPLCMCHCCGGVTIVSNSDNNLISPMLSDKLSIYTQNSPSEISFSIWQPPKV
ncbi:MAG: hypothetical protein HY840_10800 [Bacteroidetes bacterium]|nr:hypothetical protein [Bacteroidota bacterium]